MRLPPFPEGYFEQPRPAKRLFDAFLSYKHLPDAGVASEIQRRVEMFGSRSVVQHGGLRLFRDQTAVPAGPSIRDNILDAIRRSRRFILLASPEAAAAPWVKWELREWLRRSGESSTPLRLTNVMVVLSAGNLAWDAGTRSIDWAKSDAVPPLLDEGTAVADGLVIDLRRVEWSEPLIVDLRGLRNADLSDIAASRRLDDAAAAIAAELLGRDKDEIASERLHVERRRVLIFRYAVAGLVAIVAALAVLIIVAGREREKAIASGNEARRAVADGIALNAIRLSRDRHYLSASVLATAAREYGQSVLVEAATLGIRPSIFALGWTRQIGGETYKVAASVDGQVVVLFGADSRLRIVTPDRELRLSDEISVNFHPVSGCPVTFNNDGSSLYVGTIDGKILAVDPTTGRFEVRRSGKGRSRFVRRFGNEDYRFLCDFHGWVAVDDSIPDQFNPMLEGSINDSCAADASGGTRVTTTVQGKILIERPGQSDVILQLGEELRDAGVEQPQTSHAIVDVSADGHWMSLAPLSFGTPLPAVMIYDLKKPRPERLKLTANLDLDRRSQSEAAFIGDSSVVAWLDGNSLMMIDCATTPAVKELRRFEPAVELTAFAPHPSIGLYALGRRDGCIELCVAGADEPFEVIDAHQESVGSLAFTDDGTSLISCSDDRSVRCWNIALRSSPVSVSGGMLIRSAAVSSAGTTIAVASVLGNPVVVVPMTPGRPIQEIGLGDATARDLRIVDDDFIVALDVGGRVGVCRIGSTGPSNMTWLQVENNRSAMRLIDSRKRGRILVLFEGDHLVELDTRQIADTLKPQPAEAVLGESAVNHLRFPFRQLADGYETLGNDFFERTVRRGPRVNHVQHAVKSAQYRNIECCDWNDRFLYEMSAGGSDRSTGILLQSLETPESHFIVNPFPEYYTHQNEIVKHLFVVSNPPRVVTVSRYGFIQIWGDTLFSTMDDARSQTGLTIRGTQVSVARP